MFTTLQQFHDNFRIQNNQQPNETVLNRGLFRLKREIRELKTILDLIQGKNIEEWNKSKIYEIDEYVMYKGLVYRSQLDGNYEMNPETSGFWELTTIENLKRKNYAFDYNYIIAYENQTEFFTDFTISSTPAVFVEGLLYDPTEFTWKSNCVIFNKPITNRRRVTIISGVNYLATPILPKKSFVALEDQYVFNTPFEVNNPTVFVDGLLQQDNFFFGIDYIEFYEPLSAGQKVTIINGFYDGLGTYTKEELDNKFNDIYTKSEVFSKVETQTKINEARESILSDSSLAKTNNVYNKSEIDGKLHNLVDIPQFNLALDGKADKANTLKGYNIEDSYTKLEIDDKLLNKLDEDMFTREELVKKLNANDSNVDITLLNADTLNNLDSSSFLRSDIKTKNTSGLSISNDDDSVIFDLDPLKKVVGSNVILNKEKTFKDTKKVFNGYNSEELYFICEGDFRGVWWSDIREFGIANFKDYNWIVDVSFLGDNSQFDFVPKNYGYGLPFLALNKTLKNTNFTTYQFGFVDNEIVKMYCLKKTKSNDVIPLYAHYRLIGIKKEISTKITRNQGDNSIDYIQHNGISDEQFQSFILSAGDITHITPPDIISDNAFRVEDNYDPTNVYNSSRQLRELRFKYVQDTSDVNIINFLIYDGFCNRDVSFSSNGCVILSKPSRFDHQGFAFLKIRIDTLNDGLISVFSKDTKTLDIVLSELNLNLSRD